MKLATWIASVALVVCGAARTSTASVFSEVAAQSANAPLQLQVSGLPALASPQYRVTGLAQSQTLALTAGPNLDPFVGPVRGSNFWTNSVTWCEFFCDFEYQPRFVFGELLPTEAPVGTTLFVGVDTNDDGLPQQNETLCEATVQANAAAQCLVDLGLGFSLSINQTLTYWVAMRLPSEQSIVLREAWLEPYNYADVTGPGHAPAGATLPLRIPFSSVNDENSPQRYYGVVLVRDGQTNTNIPFAVTAGPQDDDPVTSLSPFRVQGANPIIYSEPTLSPGESLQHAFFDVPTTSDGSLLQVDFADTVYGTDRDSIDLYLVHADFPSASNSADVAAAPAPDASSLHLIDSGPTTISLPAGRWYVRATNLSGLPATLRMVLSDAQQRPRFGGGNNPTIAPGFYYNPKRSGHGIAISQASGQQVVDWFTYLEDGTPQWYEAQAGAPDASSGWWQAPLYRVAWDGSKAHLTEVGGLTLTPIATNEFMFTWNLDGQTGSERFNALARSGSCPEFDGSATNFTGAWYAPTQSGYGMDVLSLPEQQFAAFYFYDDLGLARWGVGGSVPFAASSTLTLIQNTGFCPACAYAPITTQPLGTVNVDYTSASAGTFASQLVLKEPLSGSWSVTNPMSRLTGAASCAVQ